MSLSMRIDETGVRFRITPAALEDLLLGKTLTQVTIAGKKEVTCRIVPSEGGEMQLDMREMCFSLHVPEKELERLRDLGRSKSGIRAMQGESEIALQVDLKVKASQAA